LAPSTRLDAVRFSGDRQLWETLTQDERLSAPLGVASSEAHRKTIRMHLLSDAVRVDPRMLPKLDASIRAIRERAEYGEALEAYVYEDPTINAFMTHGEVHTYLGLSSGAVNTLSAQELEFVIGHELGHALFQHIDSKLMSRIDEHLDQRLRKRLLAWRRASEISADRCALVCCGSIDVAASAMFRTLSGLSLPGLAISPDDFSEQWDQLLAEVARGGEDDVWQSSHPFPPLRMKSMVLFWQCDTAALPAGRPDRGLTLEQVDEEVNRLLTTMDPLAREKHDAADPLLEDLLLWGGLYVAFAGGAGDAPSVAQLKHLVASGAVDRGLELTHDHEQFASNFQSAIGRRRKKLKALEINRLLKSMLHVGCAKGGLTDKEIAAFNRLGAILGIEERACDLVRERFLDETKRS
jgi:hypothetical protein